ncbi:hypothetical protein C789_3217 [Microcystis aeruginosa FACHB-905 = DIANCHI905]|nr:hypothetical protein C789_3217 [Microcystis aeruginosa FACHB-905 = DIANCHI905]
MRSGRGQEAVGGRQYSGVRRQEIGDYFIYSPHTPHPTPHTPHPAPRKSFLPQTLVSVRGRVIR